MALRARRPEIRARSAALALVAAASLAAGIAAGLHHGAGAPRRLVPAAGNRAGTFDPLAYRPGRAATFERAAAAGLAHVLYAKSPGGVVATARRVARWRPVVDQVAAGAHEDPDTLEAIVFLESAGRPDATASSDLSGAVGLTQILAETGTDLLGLHIDLARSRHLTRGIARGRRVRARRALRRRVDERFDPRKALEATTRYLAFARSRVHRDDLAVVAYHMGVGNLQQALAGYGAGDIPYVQLYFDSSPLHHAVAWAKLASLGDDSSTYLWRLDAARQIMALFRADPAALARTAMLQRARHSAEEVLHPPDTTPVFASPAALGRARAVGTIVGLPAGLLRLHGIAVDPRMGELAQGLREPAALYGGLRPEALALLVYLGAGTEALAHVAPLTLTSTVRDERYQRALAASDPEATHGYSLHTTGWAFDVLRRYRSRAQALAFQFMLDRLTALNLIAWVREPAAIHVTVASGARTLLGLLSPAALAPARRTPAG